MDRSESIDLALLDVCERMLTEGCAGDAGDLLAQITRRFSLETNRIRANVVRFAVLAHQSDVARAFADYSQLEATKSRSNLLSVLINRLSYLRLHALADTCIRHMEAIAFLGEQDILYQQAKDIIAASSAYYDQIVEMAATGEFEKIDLAEFHDETTFSAAAFDAVDGFAGTLKMHDAFREDRPVGEIRSTYQQDFDWADDALKTLLEYRNFNAGIARDRPDGGYCYHGARFGGLDARTCCVFDRLGRARPSQLPHLSRTLNTTVARPATRLVENAILVPVSFAPRNYSHTLSEMCYGLRAVDWFPDDWPIVADYDRFGLLSHFLDALGIDQSRVMTFEQARDVYFNFLAAPRHPYFFWTERHYAFYRRLCVPPDDTYRYLYLSRSKSSRPLTDEVGIEDHMRRRGFAVIHAEDLSVAEQIRAFSSCDLVITPHGAGLTNMIFCRAGTQIIELFRRDYIRSPFYLQTQNGGFTYRCLLEEDEGIDIATLDAMIDAAIAGAGARPAAPEVEAGSTRDPG